tara:strand:+ start:51 stop:479 length:429 start_codon:yes stop_codon:yes gene_type:complete
MKFKFSLEPVLKVRQHQEKIQKQKLAEEISNKNKITLLRNEAQKKLENYLDNKKNQTAANIHLIKRHNAHIVEVNEHINKLGDKEKEANGKVKNERGKLAEAFKKLSILEKVKETEQGLYVKAEASVDLKFMDEISTQSFNR